MRRESISANISYFPPVNEPLSANSVIIEGERNIWIYDVGNSSDICNEINSMQKPKIIILSHFHSDHTGGLEKIKYDKLYQGANTYKYTKQGNVINKETAFTDGDMSFRIMEIPSSHAKGSLILEVNETYCFVGDATYATKKKGKICFNSGLLLEQIKILKSIKATYICLSHKEPFCVEKKEVINELENLYSLRKNNEPYIFL